MSSSLRVVIQNYVEIYRKLYQRTPTDLKILDRNWVIVNGVRLRLSDLEDVTHHMRQEYEQATARKRSIILRLLDWFKG
jgi:hypothetical protein